MLQCATAARVSRTRNGASDPPALATAGAIPGQWLFRAEVKTASGSGSLRLVLRRFDASRFTLSASDALGQARWEIRSDGIEAVWLEPEAHRFCRLDARRALRTPQWVSSISVADIAGLLTGEWPPEDALAPPPVPPESPAPPASGLQRITGDRAQERWTNWTLWEGSEPLVWFKRLGTDSLLSARQPAVQFRWRLTARGGLGDLGNLNGGAFVLLPGQITARAREIACPDNAIP